jgi:hypothetical protein
LGRASLARIEATGHRRRMRRRRRGGEGGGGEEVKRLYFYSKFICFTHPLPVSMILRSIEGAHSTERESARARAKASVRVSGQGRGPRAARPRQGSPGRADIALLSPAPPHFPEGKTQVRYCRYSRLHNRVRLPKFVLVRRTFSESRGLVDRVCYVFSWRTK